MVIGAYGYRGPMVIGAYGYRGPMVIGDLWL